MNSLEIEKSDGVMPTEIIYKDQETGQLLVAAKNLDEMVTIKAKKFFRLWKSSPRTLKLALKKGPVTVMVNSQGPFKYYKHGVLDSEHCTPEVDHAVLAVGYGTYTNDKGKLDDYFILKNSWGRYWGENGYVRVTASRNQKGFKKKGMCGIYVESYQPLITELSDKELQKYKNRLDVPDEV